MIFISILLSIVGFANDDLSKTSSLLESVPKPECLFAKSTVKKLLSRHSFSDTKPHINIGILGQEGHGKAVVTSAITKVLSDIGKAKFTTVDKIKSACRNNYKKVMGATMAINSVPYETDKRRYTHMYFPEHEDYVKAMISGAVKMDGAILIVSGEESWFPQTREQIRLARIGGVKSLVVFISTDDPDDPVIRNVVDETRGRLSAYGFPGDEIPIIKGSAQKYLEGKKKWKAKISQLIGAIDKYIPTPTKKSEPFLMPIENISTIQGRGTVATGGVERGIIKVNESVEIVGIRETQSLVITGVEKSEGKKVGLLLRGINPTELEKGQVIAKPGTITSKTKFDAEVYLFNKKEGGMNRPLRDGDKPLFGIRTVDVSGKIHLPEEVFYMPGDNFNTKIELTKPMAMEKGLRFSIVENGSIVGVGIVVKLLA